MNRKLKRVIATFLAVVMVAFAAPFTATATLDSNYFVSWSDTQENGGVPIGWWGDSEYRQWLNEENIPYGEQEYDGLNTLGEGNLLYDAWYEENEMGFSLGDSYAPYTMWGGYKQGNASLDSSTYEIIDDYAQAAYDHLADMKPVVTITVSSQGTSENRIRNKYYMYTKTYTTSKVESDGNLLDPGHLEAGQRIAITIEMGGIDTLSAGQLKGIYNVDYLATGFYDGSPTSSDTWTTITDSSSTSAVLKRGTALNSYITDGTTYNTVQGEYIRQSGGLDQNGDYNTAGYGRADKYGDESYYGQFYSIFDANESIPYSVYVGYDAEDGEPVGDNGFVLAIYSFEVLQDCDLMDVFYLTEDLSGSSRSAVTYVYPYSTASAQGEAGVSATQFNFSEGTISGEYAYADYMNTYGMMALEVANYTPAEDDEEEEYTYGDPVFDWAEDYSSCTATFTANEDETVTEEVTCTVTSEETTAATCTTDGVMTYTATATFNDVEYTDPVEVAIPATGHTEGEAVTENEVAATCTEDGSHDEVVYCSVCGEELSRETVTDAATGHSWDDGTETTAATCEDEGVMTYTCTVCGETKTEAISATGHTAAAAVTENYVAATCTEDGSYDSVVYCSVCGAEISRTPVTVAATDHDWSDDYYVEWADDYSTATAKFPCNNCDATNDYELDVTSETTAATCTEDGQTVYTASFSGTTIDTQTVVITATGHSYTAEVTAPTCTEEGYTTYTCSACGDTYIADYTDATGHTTEVQNAKDATCTEDGYTGDTVCTVCGETIETGEAIPATGHSYESVTTEATCTEEGSIVYTCTVCDDTYTEVIPAKGHTEGTPVTENYVAATYTTEGSYDTVVYCTVCGEELSRETTVIPVSTCEHANTTTINAVEATCTTDGYTGDTYCEDCQQIVAAGETIPATGHTEGEAVVENEVAATCTTDGSYDTVVYCTVCDEELSRETITVAATGHTEGEAVVENEVAATCGTDGSYDSVVYCSICGEELSRTTETVAATGEHTYDEGVVTEAATCTEDGEMTYTCTVCGDTKTEAIAATGHTAGEAVIENEVAATYTADGSYDEVVYCTVCGEELSRETVTDPMLTGGVTVTVNEVDLGVITVEGDTDGDQSVTVARNSTVTLTAEAVEGAEFVGWALGASIVSTDATYTVTALADVTYTAIFTETADTFIVVFTDSYGNVISTQYDLTSGADIVIPTPTNVVGYTFTGWSLSDDEIYALTSGATIVAQYTKDASTSYTVTAAGATITTSSAEAADVLDGVAYDTQVTVYAEGATSWTVNGATVAYGDTYTFYVGADIELVAVYDAVTEAPTVAIIDISSTGSTGAVRAVFLATRTMTNDCTYVSSGFIYGKAENVTAATTLDDVDNSTVKRVDNSTSVEQFSLTYGLSAQSGKVAAMAYLAYIDENGDYQVKYSSYETWSY